MQRSRSNEAAPARGQHGQPVVVATVVAATFPLGMLQFMAAFHFPAQFSGLSCYLVFKRRMYLALF